MQSGIQTRRKCCLQVLAILPPRHAAPDAASSQLKSLSWMSLMAPAEAGSAGYRVKPGMTEATKQLCKQDRASGKIARFHTPPLSRYRNSDNVEPVVSLARKALLAAVYKLRQIRDCVICHYTIEFLVMAKFTCLRLGLPIMSPQPSGLRFLRLPLVKAPKSFHRTQSTNLV